MIQFPSDLFLTFFYIFSIGVLILHIFFYLIESYLRYKLRQVERELQLRFPKEYEQYLKKKRMRVINGGKP